MYDKNPLQCCEVISLQLIKINEKKKKRTLKEFIHNIKLKIAKLLGESIMALG